jgi:hypothetical protein
VRESTTKSRNQKRIGRKKHKNTQNSLRSPGLQPAGRLPDPAARTRFMVQGADVISGRGNCQRHAAKSPQVSRPTPCRAGFPLSLRERAGVRGNFNGSLTVPQIDTTAFPVRAASSLPGKARRAWPKPRNPRVEIRRKSEIRNPKRRGGDPAGRDFPWPIRISGFGLPSDFGFRLFGFGQPDAGFVSLMQLCFPVATPTSSLTNSLRFRHRRRETQAPPVGPDRTRVFTEQRTSSAPPVY